MADEATESYGQQEPGVSQVDNVNGPTNELAGEITEGPENTGQGTTGPQPTLTFDGEASKPMLSGLLALLSILRILLL